MAVVGGLTGGGGSISPVPFQRPVDLAQLINAFLTNRTPQVAHAIHGQITPAQVQILIRNMLGEQASAFPGLLR